MFNDSSSQGLQNAIYFYTSKIFGLRAADEHSNLDVNNLILGLTLKGNMFNTKAKF